MGLSQGVIVFCDPDGYFLDGAPQGVGAGSAGPAPEFLGVFGGEVMIERLKMWARAIKRDVVALWLAARDPRVPVHAKVLAAVVAAYALSPIDLIPDFVPILGYLDDLIIVPLGIALAVRLIPAALMAELRLTALDHSRPCSRAGLVAVLAIWLGAAVFAAWWLWPRP